MTNLGNLIDQSKDLNKVAVVHNNQSYSYEYLNTLVTGVSAGLVAHGIVPGDRVAILSENSVKFIATYLGILRMGAVAVLINCKLPGEQINYILNDSDTILLFIDRPVITPVTTIHFNNLEKFLSNKPVSVVTQDPAVILYTSGSTSVPKGVVLSHNHKWIIDSNVANSNPSIKTILVAAPMYHMNGLSNMETAIAGYATLVLMSRFEPMECLSLSAQHQITTITSVPTMLAMMLEKKTSEDLSSVKEIIMASAPVSRNLFDNVKQAFPNAFVKNAYGITEVGPGIFGRHPTMTTPELSVGYPRRGMDYKLVDNVLYVRSPAMMLKYNNIDSTAITEDGYFITNDLFRIDDNGFYYFIGRADDMFVSGGNNIYPRQVETVIESYPGIISAAVVGIDDEIKGKKPYAFITASVTVKEDDLTEYVLTKLPHSHCPRKFWTLEQMPLTSINKIDKKKLTEMAINELQ